MNTEEILFFITLFFITLCLAIIVGHKFAIKPIFSSGLFLWHTSFSLFYCYWSLNNLADATVYYENAQVWQSYSWRPGTDFVTSLTKVCAEILGTSYVNTFLIFNVFGLVGLIVLAKTLLDFWPTRGGKRSIIPYMIIFLPGISFWSAAIGKDGISFLAAVLAVYGFIDPSRRTVAIGIAVVLMFMVRPHMAILMVFSGAIAFATGRAIPGAQRILLLAVLIGVGVAAYPFVIAYVGLGDGVSINSVSSYISQRQGYNLGGGSSVNIRDIGLPMQIITFLFRPFFFDAGGALGLVVSFENLLLVILFVRFFIPHIGKIMTHPNVALRYNFFFFILSLMMFSTTVANLGIAIRMKTMMQPSIFFLIAIAAQMAQGKSQASPLVNTRKYTVQ